ncbi:extracellular solute-binding protein [Paenibacillus sp. J5C_2022]|uniref:extracellular solute-binding protein n=1 Tax=Paenibacillus sp. J5C2022 TaxID=2977129 RepID=UPI0021D13743|nr:extracellular solute-binding protein [Paenibacillus sp. J5C2022]MCU6709035.1 extracellular solute-binding protein [Paenibacillus sp. J5C2022]
MKKKSWLMLLFIIVLTVGTILAGCSKGDSKATGTDTQGGKATGGNNAGKSEGDKTPVVTLDWFVAEEWFQRNWDPDNNLMDKKMLEDIGVELNFTSGSLEKLSAMIASGDIPDLVTLNNQAAQRGVLERSGYVIPLDELLSEHAPNMVVPPSVQDWFRAEDGHYYGLPNYFYAPEDMTDKHFYPTHNTMRARQDLMNRLGIEASAFDTKEGTLEALRKVKEAKLEYDGFEIVPAYFFYDNLIQFFGADREDEQGNYVDMFREPESLEVYKFLNQLYRERLLPEDSLTLTEAQVQEKVNAGSVFAYTNWRIKWNGLFQSDEEAVYVPAGPIKGDDGNPFHFKPSSLGGWTMTMVGKKTEHEERVAKLLEYLSQDQMSLEALYGPEGIGWKYDDGHVKFTEQYLQDYAKDPTAADMKYKGVEWLVNWLDVQPAFPLPTNENERLESVTEAHFSQYSFNTLPFEAVTPKGGTEEAAINTKIEEYRESMGAKMVLAKSEDEVEKLFNDMQAQEEKLGYDKLYAYWNDHFKDTKQKLGMDFAWPENQ